MNKLSNIKHYDLSNTDKIKVGVLSDTHSYINPTILEHLSECDVILHAGDIGSISVIKQLRDLCKEVIPVCGNNDNLMQWSHNEHADLGNIPQIAKIHLPGGVIAITHGDEYYADYEMWHAQLRKNFSGVKAIIYGHSHRLVCDQSQLPWVLNPGAAGETRIQKHGVSCLLMNLDNQNWCVEEYRV